MQIVTDRFILRPVTETEREAVLGIYRQCEDFLALGPDPYASMAMVEADIRHSEEEGGIFCGIFAPNMVGIIDFVPRLFEGKPEQACLSLLMIALPYRNFGLGADVVRAVEDYIQQDEKVEAILAGVQINNPGAIRFWQRMGYQIISGPLQLPDQTTVYQLRKDLRD